MRDFLDFVMLPGGFVELRAFSSGKVKQWWEKDRQAASDLALKLSDDGWDAYYGVLPRRIHGGDAEAVSPVTRTLWADLDAKTHGDKRQTLMAIIQRASVPPSVLVDSGHGYHAYWRMRDIVPFEQARAMMRGIAQELDGDHVYDAPRILRLPGTMNYKDPGNPVPVRTVVFNTTAVYRPADLHDYEGLGRSLDKPHPPRVAYTPPEDRDALPDWLERLIRDGAPQGQRSEAAWAVMKGLIDQGWDDTEIRAAFDGGAIGDKMREQNDGGERWFNRSLERARR